MKIKLSKFSAQKIFYLKILCTFLVHFITVTARVYPQNSHIVTGKVTDINNEPLIGVTIQEVGTSNGTVTNIDGDYSIRVQSDASDLIFTYIGYQQQQIKVGNQTAINVVLAEETSILDELIVIGYGSVKKSDLTGSIQRVDANTFRNQSMNQATDMLSGTVAGFNFTQSTSAAGGGTMEIRGQTSLTASTEPMIVLDGAIFNGSLRDVNPNDIESIEVLKDASSSAIFGARAANGIILITTKKGSKGKPTITFSSQLGVSSTTNDFKPYDKDGYLKYRRDLQRQKNPSYPSYYYDDPNNLPNNVTLDEWRNASANPQNDNEKEWLSRLNFFGIEVDNYVNGNTVDWFDETMRTGTRQKYDLSIGGATDNTTYYWSVDYQKNEGVIRGDDFSAIRTRLNFDFDITSWLNAGINTHFSERDESSVPVNWTTQMYYMSPYGSKYEEDGSLKWYPNTFALQSPLLNYNSQQKHRKINTLFASSYLNVKLPFAINYKISFQPNYTFSNNYNFYPSSVPNGGSGGKGSREEFKSLNWILDHLISWNREFGQHRFDVTLLYSAEKYQGWTTTASNELFVPNENLGFSGLQFGTNPSVSSNDTQTTADAMMGRINYSLAGKYLLTASVRRDGYSAFGVQNPRATFPALALAWNLHEEDFFSFPEVNQMKLRASWGKNGNRSIQAYSALAQLNSAMYYNGSQTQVGVYSSSLPNNELKWEQTEAYNFGLNLILFKNRLDITGDFYIMNTFDLLMSRKLPEITGFTDIMANLGQLRNKGLELTINTVNIQRKDFQWSSNLIYSANRNKIVKLFGDYEDVEVDGKIVRRELPDYTNQWFPGQAIDRIWDYKTSGIWQENEREEAAKYRLEPGDWKALDVDKNGLYEAIQDKMFIGHREPRHRIGLRNNFNYRNFSLSFLFRAELGHSAAFQYARQAATSDTGDKRNTWDIPYWTKENPINDYPRLVTRTNVFGGGIEIYKPRSFVRLQDLSLSYSLPSHLIQRIGIGNAEIYYSGHNLFYISKWPGWDPESLNTPMYRNHTLGIRLTL